MMEARCVVVGAGFAGAATACHLARRRLGPVALVERERSGGMHSSGRNAAMVRQLVADPALAGMARAGARAIRELSQGPRPVQFTAGGSLLFASGKRTRALLEEAAGAREAGLGVESWPRAVALDRVPLLEGAEYEEGFFCPSDGVVDIAALLERYLGAAREAGAQVIFGAELEEVRTSGGKVTGVRAGGRLIETPAVVNAAGAWAGGLAERAGATAIPLRPLRRHLMYTGPYPRASRSWPFVWDVAHEVYFRPESEGLLLSPCDETLCDPCLPENDPAALDLLRRKLGRHLPALRDVPIARTWAGLRICTPDGRFVIGPDPELEGFFWAAGLGGHGVASSDPVGALAAELVERPERDAGNPFSPGRFGSGARHA